MIGPVQTATDGNGVTWTIRQGSAGTAWEIISPLLNTPVSTLPLRREFRALTGGAYILMKNDGDADPTNDYTGIPLLAGQVLDISFWKGPVWARSMNPPTGVVLYESAAVK